MSLGSMMVSRMDSGFFEGDPLSVVPDVLPIPGWSISLAQWNRRMSTFRSACFVQLPMLLLSTAMARPESPSSLEPGALIQRIHQCVPAIENTGERAALRQDIAAAEARAGNSEKAASALREAAQAARAMEDRHARGRDMVLAEIAVAQAGILDTLQALQTVETIDRETARLYAVSSIAGVMAAKGNVQDARELTNLIKDAFWRDAALMNIAWAQAEAGDLDGSQETVRAIQDDSVRDTTLLQIVVIRARSNDFGEALQIAQSLEEPVRKGRALDAIALAQLKAGKQEAAVSTHGRVLKVAGLIRDETGAALAAIAQARIGAEYSAAFEAAKSIGAPVERQRVLAQIALIQVQRGQLRESLQTANTVADVSARARVLYEIAVYLAENNSVEKALEITGIINDDYYAAVALRRIAAVHAKRGNRRRAQEVLRKALRHVEALTAGGGVKVIAFQSLGEALLDTGDPQTATRVFDRAREVAMVYTEDAYRASLLQGIARSQSQGGLAADALDWAARSCSPIVRARALLGIHEGVVNQAKLSER